MTNSLWRKRQEPEALKLALEALQLGDWMKVRRAIFMMKEALTQPEQEPVAWINWCAATGNRSVSFVCESELASQPLYTKEKL